MDDINEMEVDIKGVNNQAYHGDAEVNPVSSTTAHDESSAVEDGSPLVECMEVDGADEAIDTGSRALHKTIGYKEAFSLMVGSIIGGGIFISPQVVASGTSNVGMMLIVWIVTGALSMIGSLCYCELGSMFKVAGGNYLNILKIYGRVPAFLCAWTTCIFISPSKTAATALTIGSYLSKLFYTTELEAESTAKIIGIAVITFTVLLNFIGSRYLNRVQGVLSVLQTLSLVFLISVGIWQLSLGKFDNYRGMFINTTLTSGIGIALYGALWSYDGWTQINSFVEEMTNVERDFPITVFTAFPFIIGCYLLVNLAFLSLLSRREIAAEDAVGIVFIHKALGQKASYLMMTLVGLVTFGSLNGGLYSASRVTLAAAREGHMPIIFSFIHNKSRSPILSTVLNATIAMLMLISSDNLHTLLLIFSQLHWVVYGASAIGVVILRIRQPNAERPFRVFIGFPILTFSIAVVLVVIPFFESPFLSLALLGFILIGLPVYVIFVRLHDKLPSVFLRMMEKATYVSQQHFGMVPCHVNEALR